LIFHHVGVGVLDLDRAIDVYAALGHSLLVKVDDVALNVRIAFVSPGPGAALIELIAPLAGEGPLTALMKRHILPAPYHTCYAVSDLPTAICKLEALGFMRLTEPKPAVAMGGALIAFLSHRDVGLLEFVENPTITP
jgi:methylmalonyl-CoA/ethylmalonyl-CoA epimerase